MMVIYNLRFDIMLYFLTQVSEMERYCADKLKIYNVYSKIQKQITKCTELVRRISRKREKRERPENREGLIQTIMHYFMNILHVNVGM